MKLLDRLRFLALTGLGSGLSPLAPGTAGSAAALLLAYLLETSVWPAGQGRLEFLLVFIGAAALICGTSGRYIVDRWGRRDPGAVVLDEFAGQWIALLVPLGLDSRLAEYAVAFAGFRLLDIAKPLGIRRVEKAPGGWGVLLDDVLAGAYVALTLWGLGFVI